MVRFLLITYCVLHGATLLMICYIAIVLYKSKNKPRNKVHFYVARDKDRTLCLYIGKPFRGNTQFCAKISNGVIVLTNYHFKIFCLNEDDYATLKWEDEPVEVFLNMEE